MSTASPLTPPETLTAPEAVKPIEKEKAAGMVQLKPEEIQDVEQKVDEFVFQILQLELHSDEFQQYLKAMHNLANDEIRASAQVSNRLLERPAAHISVHNLEEGGPVARNLAELRVLVEDLDPSQYGNLMEPRKLFGFIPWGNKLKTYFAKYESAQSNIRRVVDALFNGQHELEKDNAALEEEKVRLWDLMGTIERYLLFARYVDKALSNQITDIKVIDAERGRILEQEVLFYIRQKVQDLLTQQAVNVQGYLTLDLIRRNNLELIKGVDRATSTTVSAMRTAVTAAQALANQRLVLKQIEAVRETTSSTIRATSEMLKQQAGAIHEQAVTSDVNIDDLKYAFSNIYDTLDMVNNFKSQALDNMSDTISALDEEIHKAQRYLAETRAAEGKEASPVIQL